MSDDGKTTELLDVVRDEAVATRSFRLVVVEGPDAGASVMLDLGSPMRVLVGQSQACHLVLRDRLVSRRHAAADLHGSTVKVVDLGSTNGTRVNGVRVAEAYASPGDRITVGETTLRVDATDSGRATAVSSSASFGRVVGASVAMRRLHPLCERLAASDLPASIEGETGTGKELLAEALHEASARRAAPFVVFDCGSTASTMLLFGDGGGASYLEQAHGGTLVLDEITELDDEAQARLLRFLDRREVRREASGVVEADVRLLVTSRRDLDQAVQSGRLREELFFRLAVGRIELPPLREREGDVALLARTFWRAMADRRPFPDGLLDRYDGYRWPGNVRELKNVVARRVALGAVADASDRRGEPTPTSPAPDVVDHVLALDLPLVEARARVVADFEARYLAKVLARHGGNVSRAAAASGIARRYFQILRARVGEKDKKEH